MLGYEQSAVAGVVPRLDSNVSAMRWGSAASTDKAYAYDRVGQLQSADYKLLSGGVSATPRTVVCAMPTTI